MTDEAREVDLYDEVTRLFVCVPAALAVPVLVEAAIHAINCLAPEQRREALEIALAAIRDNVDLEKSARSSYAQ